MHEIDDEYGGKTHQHQLRTWKESAISRREKEAEMIEICGQN